MASRSSRPADTSPAASATAHSETWHVLFHDEFLPEFRDLDADVRRELVAAARAIELAGPRTGRPHVDTLKGSRHDNMKALRFTAHKGTEVWRAAFAFDPLRQACVLVAGAKQGQDEAAFYKRLIKTADRRFDTHLKSLHPARKASS